MEGYTNSARKIVFFMIILVNVYTVVVAWNQNFFVGLLHGMAQGNNLSDCWVCTELPKSGQFPFLGIPKFNIPWFTNTTDQVDRNDAFNLVQFLGTKKGAYQTCSNTYPRGSIRKTGYTGWRKFPGECHDTAEWKHGPREKRCSLPPGWWYLCANGKARKCLPQNWWGECTTGILLEVENPLVIRGTGFHSFVRWLIPMLGVSELEKAIVNISATVEILANATADAIVNLQKEINSLAEVTIQNRMALDLLMAKEGGVYTVINQSCCAFVTREAQIETDVHRIREASKQFHLIAQDDTSWGFTNLWKKMTSRLPNFAWLKQLFVLVVTLLILGVLTCILIKCFFWCCQNSGDAYDTWKKNQLRHRLESNKYFSKVLDQESIY
uniref:Envelope protein syncytin-rum1 n=1 Tax=Strix occidentalis caurina TaxID=311401 RepID=A0A8D0FLS1_STROC